MKIIVNEYGQVERVEQSHLVANGSLQLRISVEIEGITQKQKEQMSIGYLSVIREDGFEIVDLLMERDASGANLVFSHKVQDSSQILAIPGNIQISAQIKALKEEYIGATQDELQNLENYYTFATVSVVGFVQKNIGSQREVGYAEKIIANNVRPIAYSVSTLQNDFADLQDEFEQVKEEFKDVQQGSVDDALSATSTLPVQNKVVTAALNSKAEASALAGKQDKLQAGSGIVINGNVISSTGGSGGGGSSITIDNAISETSTNPVQNRAIAAALNQKQGKLTAGDGIILKENTLQAYGVYRGDYNVAKSYETNDIIYWQGGGSAKAGYRVFITRMAGEDELRQQTPGVVLDPVPEIESKTREFAGSIVVDDYLSEYSTNPVQNKVIALAQQNAISSVRSEIGQYYLKKSDAVNNYVPNSEFRKKYIDLSQYFSGGVINYSSFNAKLRELAQQGKGGQDRVDIYFYQTGSEPFVFSNGIVWQSNCNYHYLGIRNNGITEGIYLRAIENCKFYGFSVYLIGENPIYALLVEACSNIEFYDCHFENQYQIAVNIYNSRSVYFEDCTIYGGNYPSQQPCVSISDNGAIAGDKINPSWIIFDNCYIHQGTVDASTPLVDCSSVSNTNSLVSILHCVTNGMEDVTASNVSKGSGKIRISQLTTV